MTRKPSRENLTSVVSGKNPELSKDMEAKYLEQLLAGATSKGPSGWAKAGAVLQDIGSAGQHVMSAGKVPLQPLKTVELRETSENRKRDALMKLFKLGELSKERQAKGVMERVKKKETEAKTAKYVAETVKVKIPPEVKESPRVKQIRKYQNQVANLYMQKGHIDKANKLMTMSEKEFENFLESEKKESPGFLERLGKLFGGKSKQKAKSNKIKKPEGIIKNYRQYRGM